MQNAVKVLRLDDGVLHVNFGIMASRAQSWILNKGLSVSDFTILITPNRLQN